MRTKSRSVVGVKMPFEFIHLKEDYIIRSQKQNHVHEMSS